MQTSDLAPIIPSCVPLIHRSIVDMRLTLGTLAAGALLVGYSAVSLACDDASCNLKPETPAAFDVACGTVNCRSDASGDKGNGQLKADQLFEAACLRSCDHRPEPVVKPFRMTSCVTNNC